jgi:hypothetical protein
MYLLKETIFGKYAACLEGNYSTLLVSKTAKGVLRFNTELKASIVDRTYFQSYTFTTELYK